MTGGVSTPCDRRPGAPGRHAAGWSRFSSADRPVGGSGRSSGPTIVYRSDRWPVDTESGPSFPLAARQGIAAVEPSRDAPARTRACAPEHGIAQFSSVLVLSPSSVQSTHRLALRRFARDHICLAGSVSAVGGVQDQIIGLCPAAPPVCSPAWPSYCRPTSAAAACWMTAATAAGCDT